VWQLLDIQRLAGGHSGMRDKEVAPIKNLRVLETK
jgi:hypothetical protein